MVRYPVNLLRAGLYSYTPYNWEILATFLQLQDTVPVWINCSTWGSQEPDTGRWTGAVGEVTITLQNARH